MDHKENYCPNPNCRALLAVHMAFGKGPAQPEPDALTLCAYCGALLVFDQALELRAAEPRDTEGMSMAAKMRIGLMQRRIIAEQREPEKRRTN